MRKFLAIVGALAMLGSSALAADMPVKAPPVVSPFINWTGSGLFWELGTYAGVAQSRVNGSSLLLPSLVSSNVVASGGGVEAGGGYIHGNTNTLGFGNWYMIEAKGAYQNIQGGVQVPGGDAGFFSRWSATQDACVGADLITAIGSVIGNLGINWPTWSPSLPANVQVGIPKQCFGAEVREFGLGGQFGGATGTSVGVAPGLITQFIYPTLGSNGLPNGGAVKVWASVDWNTKGFTFTNVFGKTGPVGVTTGVSEGTTYLAGIDFALAFK
jgi:hypothetical protein